MEIITMKIDELLPASYNPRKDLQPGDPEYERLYRSITEFGYVEPIVWNRRTGRVVGGHQRLKVLKAQGYTEVSVSVVDLDEQKEKALNVALNKIGGDWDEAKLVELLQELEKDMDLELTGFTQKELDKLIKKMAEKDAEEKPELEFTEELMEEHNYIVLYFDNRLDWQAACEKLGIEPKKALDSREGYKRVGTGRVIRGADLIERIY